LLTTFSIGNGGATVMDMGASGFALKLFGNPRLVGPDGADRTPRLRKAFCLLAYLALQPNGQARRERLIDLFWGDRGQAQAQGSLRHALVELRQSLDDQADDLLTADRLSVRLDTHALAVDALGMDRLLAVGTVEAILQASAGWTGELLDGVSSPGTAFDHWLEAERASRQAAILHALEGAVTEAERSGRDRDVEALAQALLRVDPAHERGHRVLIDLHARKGAIGAALRQFEQCRKALAHSLDIEPSAELRSHVAALRRQQSSASRSPTRM
jgi:DNA-binding SARP family transcriptional activator